MPRQKNTRPTNIYWLYDTRPETVAVFGPEGQPFYCGKTVGIIEKRLLRHRNAAAQGASRKTYAKIQECGQHVRTQLIEVVPLGTNWVEREKFWIAQIRAINPNATNISSGGGGAAGAIWTPEQRAALSLIRTGHRHSAATCAKISASSPQKALSRERQRQIKKRALCEINRRKYLGDFKPLPEEWQARLKRLAGNTPQERRQHKKRFGYLYA